VNSILNRWRSDKLKTALEISWLLTVFFCFFGSAVFLIKIPGFPALYPFRVLLPVTAALYLIWAVREKRNPWKGASFAQRVSYVLCAVLAVYSTLSLRFAIDFSYTAPLWITLCFDLVFFALMLELCNDRNLFITTVRCALVSLLIQILMGIREVFFGGIFTQRYNVNHNFAFFDGLWQSPVVATGNTNDYVMGIVFTLALVLLYWAWRGHKGKLDWIPVVLIAPTYLLLRAAGARLCMISFWLLLVGFALHMLTQGKKKVWMLIVTALLLFVVAFGCGDFQITPPAAQETPVTAESTAAPVQQSLKEEIFTVDAQTGETQLNLALSGGVRVDLLLCALDCFVQSKGMGVGLGNTAQTAKLTADSRGGVWGIHCFLARMAADFGIWFLIPLLMIAGSMLWFGVTYVYDGIKTHQWTTVMTGVLYILSVVIYPIASTASGDAQNSLPMWLFLGGIVLFPVHTADK